jgi:hypothetical protein
MGVVSRRGWDMRLVVVFGFPGLREFAGKPVELERAWRRGTLRASSRGPRTPLTGTQPVLISSSRAMKVAPGCGLFESGSTDPCLDAGSQTTQAALAQRPDAADRDTQGSGNLLIGGWRRKHEYAQQLPTALAEVLELLPRESDPLTLFRRPLGLQERLFGYTVHAGPPVQLRIIRRDPPP